MPSRADVDLLVDTNQKIRELATRAVDTVFDRVDLSRAALDEARDVLLATTRATVETFAETAATVAADHYELTRAAAGVQSPFTAVLADAPANAAIDASTRWALSPLYDHLDADAARERLDSVVDRMTLDTSNQTIIKNALIDPDKPRVARIPHGKTCAFCRLLASRGAVYRSEATALSGRHAHCDCTVHAVWTPDDLPDDYDLDGLRAEYHRAREAAGSGDIHAILAEMRKADAAANKAQQAAQAALREAEEKAAAKIARKAEQAAAKVRAETEIAERYGVSADEVVAARAELRELRRRVADEAARDQYDALGILERSEALSIKRPPRSGAGAEYDWLERVGPGERARLSRKWYDDSPSHSIDNVAGRLRTDLGGDLVNMTDDEIMAEVWLPLNRRVEASGAVRRGKLPSERAYGNRVDIDQFAPGVSGDGYDVMKLLGDDLEAAGHVAAVNRAQHADQAYRALGNAVQPLHGPAPYKMSFQTWEDEVRTLEEGLDGITDLAVSRRVAEERLDELMPYQLDATGMSYEDLYASIVTTARQASLDVPSHAVIAWA